MFKKISLLMVIAALASIISINKASAQVVINSDGSITVGQDEYRNQTNSTSEYRAQEVADFLYSRINMTRAQYSHVQRVFASHINSYGTTKSTESANWGHIKQDLRKELSNEQLKQVQSYKSEIQEIIRNGASNYNWRRDDENRRYDDDDDRWSSTNKKKKKDKKNKKRKKDDQNWKVDGKDGWGNEGSTNNPTPGNEGSTNPTSGEEGSTNTPTQGNEGSTNGDGERNTRTGPDGYRGPGKK